MLKLRFSPASSRLYLTELDWPRGADLETAADFWPNDRLLRPPQADLRQAISAVKRAFGWENVAAGFKLLLTLQLDEEIAEALWNVRF